MIVNIIGSGPRGLAVALYALTYNHQVNLIDPKPLHTWSSSYLIPSLEMRSPITFDLVTYLPSLTKYSLATHLNTPILFTTNQSTIEGNQTKVTREQFCGYLNTIYKLISPLCNTYTNLVKDVVNNKVILDNGVTLEGDAVVYCNGFIGKDKKPHWLKNTTKSTSIVSLPTVLANSEGYLGRKWLVLGCGQGSAEIVEYLVGLGGLVIWVTTKTPRVYQYPAPDHSLWGSKSALGDYYRKTTDYKTRISYLQSIKQWQPSITPYISKLLSRVSSKYTQITISKYSDIESLDFDYCILANGITPSVLTLPTSTRIPTNPYLPSFPDIQKAFKLNLADRNWYISGVLATGYDGPRQSSLISAGLTAKEIIEDINNGNL